MDIPIVITMLAISPMVTMEGQYPKTLETRKISRTVTTNTSRYEMRTVTPTTKQTPENRHQGKGHRHQGNMHGIKDIRRGHEYHDYQDILKVSHGIYSKTYIDKFVHLQDNQRSNNINYTKEQMIPKKNKKYLAPIISIKKNMTVVLKCICVR